MSLSDASILLHHFQESLPARAQDRLGREGGESPISKKLLVPPLEQDGGERANTVNLEVSPCIKVQIQDDGEERLSDKTTQQNDIIS